MLVKTNGIVIRSIPYPGHSLIVKIFTLSDGLKTYFIKGAKSSKSKLKPAFFQPLSLVELEVVHHQTDKLNKIKEIKLSPPLTTISFNGEKSIIALFLSELLYKILKDDYPNDSLFHFIHYAIITLDESENFKNFLIYFLLSLSNHLGFYPQLEPNTDQKQYFFDLTEGCFLLKHRGQRKIATAAESSILAKLLHKDWLSVKNQEIPPAMRLQLLYLLVNYHREQLAYLGKLEAMELLEML